ncbi:hypothetical protein P255_01421 [Acinetobacter brisouii CIP 110357]|uniref:DNA transfer protein p32 n=1 Tax=Acinetobacter brisouii CIP 110357 TaxID=1341683 RepID=V2ULS8_9GAMM|nr:hypothetical protein [Acinetobacter brisouii]ENV46053.1 hypothetical protein F954_02879 [Acinetobacter brisouii ANC 4119]ESK50922.1 hypothetical protein P255_01421 [Acinetobacter brisouii CIP 110357]
MAWAAVVAGGAALIGGVVSANASKSAAKKQANAAQAASDQQLAMYNQTRDDLSPYTQAGQTSLSQLMGKMGVGGYFDQTYSGQDLYNDPSYQFRLNQGLNSVQSSAAARGGLLSGATLKALNNYASDYASTEYSNAYNRFNADQTNQFNRLSSLAGMGQNAAAQVGNNGLQTAQAVANNTMAGANATAAGQIGVANAWNSSLGTIGTLANGYIQSKGKTGGSI